MPTDFSKQFLCLSRLVINPWMTISLIGAFLVFLCRMAAMTKFNLCHTYPFISLSFVLVLILSIIFFNKSLSVFKIIGMILIKVGLVIGSQG
jgi:uncharacterized membrane protein